MTPQQRINHIVQWLQQYASSANVNRFVVGISGGIDSSVVSALCAHTGIATIVVQMPIRQHPGLDHHSSLQASWLLQHFASTVTHISLDLTTVFDVFDKKLSTVCAQDNGDNTATAELALANSRARLRMMALYQIAQSHSGLVVGTGNRVEDFGVGFFTKYGDGGVDISPIGDCAKTDVWAMGRELGLLEDIINAVPTDGLWADGRTDEDQLGMTYPELEQAMANDLLDRADTYRILDTAMNTVAHDQMQRYRAIRAQNLHKMLPIPVCKFDK